MCAAGKYNIIYADPPWNFKVWGAKGMGRSPEKHYSTQSIGSLKKMNIPAIADTNCILLMWATFPCLEQALQLGAAWGFTYKTVAFTWIKRNKSGNGIFMGLGYYTRANAEIVLLFTKGKPLKRVSKNVSQVLESFRGRHSEKPSEIRRRINRLFGPVPRIELFARTMQGGSDDSYEGWDLFGNEAHRSIELPE